MESGAASLVFAPPKVKRSFQYYRAGTFLSLLIGYSAYYLCRQNLSVAYAPMKTALGMTPMQFGAISSLGTLLYALGKVGTGAIADSRFGGRTIFYLGLFGSAVFSLIFGLGKGMTFFLVIWGINRFFQSLGWGGLVQVMSRWFEAKNYGTAMGFMSLSYQFGGVLASVYAGFLLSLGMNWQSLFTVPALTIAGIGILTRPFLVRSPEEVGFAIPTSETSPDMNKKNLPPSSYFARFKKVLSDRAFLMMLGLSFILTFLRECFNTWMPAYFVEMGASAATAAFKSAIFPLLGCLGTIFAGWLSDRVFTGRRAPVMAGLLLGLIACLVLLSYIDSLSTWTSTAFHLGKSNLAAVLVGATGFFLLGSYSFTGGVVALDFGGKDTSGTAAGLLDGAGYLGASLSGIGIAEFVLRRGWGQTFSGMGYLAVVAILFCFFLWQVKPRELQA